MDRISFTSAAENGFYHGFLKNGIKPVSAPSLNANALSVIFFLELCFASPSVLLVEADKKKQRNCQQIKQ